MLFLILSLRFCSSFRRSPLFLVGCKVALDHQHPMLKLHFSLFVVFCVCLFFSSKLMIFLRLIAKKESKKTKLPHCKMIKIKMKSKGICSSRWLLFKRMEGRFRAQTALAGTIAGSNGSPNAYSPDIPVWRCALKPFKASHSVLADDSGGDSTGEGRQSRCPVSLAPVRKFKRPLFKTYKFWRFRFFNYFPFLIFGAFRI